SHMEQDHLQSQSKRGHQDTQADERPKKVSVVGERNVYTFTPARQSFIPHTPKLPSNTVRRLEELVTILSPSNDSLPSELKAIVKKQSEEQHSLHSLKAYPVAFKMLCDAMDVPRETLPAFLWKFDISDECMVHDRQLVDVIRHVLTEFSSKCKRPAEFCSISERTFWIDRIQPIFQHFGDQTGLLGFEWCETPIKEQIESERTPQDWRAAGALMVDGRAYDKHDRNIMVMESSGTQKKERVVHTINDTVKNAHLSIEILNSTIQQNPYSRFSTIARVTVFSLQLICKTITLSTTSLDKDIPGKFVINQLRSAQIPTTYEERKLWLKVFELIALLLTETIEQMGIYEVLGTESSGILDIQKEEFVCSVLP
ncbi:hypothetical protein BGZ76_005943, partial [Entomortierella beljakovae]